MQEFRFIFKTDALDVIGVWRKYSLGAFLKDCEAFAENGISFRAEFREVHK